MAGGQRRRQLLQPVDPRDLLDQVGLAGDVGAAEVGDLDLETVAARHVGANSSALRISAQRSRGISSPSSAVEPRVAQSDRVRRGPGAADVDRAGHGRAPHSSTISSGRDDLRLHRLLGLELLLEAGRGLAAQRRASSEVRWTFGPSQVATSISTRVVPSWTSERAPPITPAIDVGPSSSSITTISLVERAGLAVERLDLLAVGPARRTFSAAARDPVEVEGVQRLPGQQHHVVGDVDDVRDRALPGRHQPRLQPQRARPDASRPEHPRGEAPAQLGALDVDDLDPSTLAVGAVVLGPGGGASGAPVAAWTSRATP